MSRVVRGLRSPAFDRLTPVKWGFAPSFCLLLLTASCALASFAFACATPFAAFAVVAAAMLPLPAALAVTTAVWIVNQAIGFGALGYPHDLNAVLWGLAIGAAALTATVAAKLMLRAVAQFGKAAAFGLAIFGAYAAYELVLFAPTPVLGGAGAFTPSIVGRLGSLNLLWLIGLLAICEIVRLLAVTRRRHSLS